MEHCNLGTRQFRYKNRNFSNTAAERRSLAALKSFCKSKSITNQLHCNSGTWQFGYNYRSLYPISETGYGGTLIYDNWDIIIECGTMIQNL